MLVLTHSRENVTAHLRLDQQNLEGWPQKCDSEYPSVGYYDHAVIDILYHCHFLLRIDIRQLTRWELKYFQFCLSPFTFCSVSVTLYILCWSPQGSQRCTIGQFLFSATRVNHKQCPDLVKVLQPSMALSQECDNQKCRNYLFKPELFYSMPQQEVLIVTNSSANLACSSQLK